MGNSATQPGDTDGIAGDSVSSADVFLNFDQFSRAMKLLRQDMTITCMAQMGMSRTDMYMWAAFLTLVLLLVIAFIFTGVAACT